MTNKKLKITDNNTEQSEQQHKPAMTLDDLFRKTEAMPAIYWLPLDDEQFIAKEAAFQKRQAYRNAREVERVEQIKAREAEIEVMYN